MIITLNLTQLCFGGGIKTLQKVCDNMQKNQTDLNNLHSEFVIVQHLFQKIDNADI